MGVHRYFMLKGLALVAVLCLFAKGADAVERNWDEGSVWTIHFAKTQPGKFNNYLKDLSNVFKRYADRLIKDEVVLSYKILQVSFPRDNEPDIIVLTEYKDMAAFDKGLDYYDSVVTEVLGSMTEAEKAEIDREQLRTLRGVLLTRELKFKN